MRLNLIREAMGPSWAPEEVHFEHPKPEGWREHERAFGAPVFFSQPTNALVFGPQILRHAMPGSDPRLREHLLVVARRRLEAIERQRHQSRHVGVGLRDVVAGVVTFATQSAGCEVAGGLDGRPLLLFHGERDEILPMQASVVVRSIAGTGDLVVLAGDGHLLARSGEVITERLRAWLPGAASVMPCVARLARKDSRSAVSPVGESVRPFGAGDNV